jgi:hypothetical protein
MVVATGPLWEDNKADDEDEDEGEGVTWREVL